MKFNEYQENVRDFRKESANFTYAIIGLGAEVGEVQDKVAKVIRDKDGKFDDNDTAAIMKELGDVLWFISAIADDMEVTLEEIARINYAKLASRKDRNQISGSGDDR